MASLCTHSCITAALLVIALPGRCDKITISPQLLAELQSCTEPLPRKLSPDMINSPDSKVDSFSTDVFNKLHGADEMAVDKLKQVRDGGQMALAM
jgi:transaldolase